jgi:PAS domain S-box-containing protein
MFGEVGGFCAVFILRTDFRNLGVVEFCNHEVHPMFGYRPDQLTGKDIAAIMPEAIGSVHRQLMMRFFDKGQSPIINKFRELFVRDVDGYLVPVLIYPKILPNLSRGLKFIGAVKRIQRLTELGPELVQGDLQKLPQEYMVCDKDGYICHFTSGLSLDLGLFPNLFMHPGAVAGKLGASGNREIKVDDLSLDFANKEQDLATEQGSYINLTTLKLVKKVERENITQEEYAYFLSKQRTDFKIFCQLTPLSYGPNLAELKLYRLILIQNSNSQAAQRNSPSMEAFKQAEDKHS